MVLQVEVDFKELLRLGRGYGWKRPAACPGCQGGLWWHGFVPIYLEGIPGQIFIRRLLCPHCGKVFRLRPAGFWPRFYHGINRIRSALESRCAAGRWPSAVSRQAGGHWLRALRRGVRMRLGLAAKVFAEGYEGLISFGWVPVSRSIRGVRIPQSG